MKKALIWLGVLVVLVVIVLVVARGGGGGEDEAEGQEPGERRLDRRELRFGETTYDRLVQMVAAQETERGLQDRMRYTSHVLGEGWVVAVKEVGDAEDELEFKIDVDPPDGKQDGAEITAYVETDRLRGEPPTEGQKVEYQGRMSDWQPEESGRLLLWLEKTRLWPLKK